MTDDNTPTNYGGMYTPPVVEAVEEVEVPELEDEVVLEGDTTDDVAEDAEPVVDVTDIFVKVNVRDTQTLRLRADSSANGAVVDILQPNAVLRVVDDADVEWLFVETYGTDEAKCGYVLKAFVVEMPAPAEA